MNKSSQNNENQKEKNIYYALIELMKFFIN